MKSVCGRLFLLASAVSTVTAFTVSRSFAPSPSKARSLTVRDNARTDHDESATALTNTGTPPRTTATPSRRAILAAGCTWTMVGWMSSSSSSPVGVPPAQALVKGNAPPPPKSASSSAPKCTNVEECQAAAERREQEQREAAAANAISYQKTPGGVRYMDIAAGSSSSDNDDTNMVVQEGDQVELYYKVLKLGKRSYDGLSGEGTVVFSRGYGLEDDENYTAGTKTFTTTVGGYRNIRALNQALLGMKVQGVRRFAVLPPDGWRKAGRECDGGPGGAGTGGDLKTDFVVVPTATMVAAEACFDSNKLPFPASYAQQRRMAQRFDQSLIMEVEVVSVRRGSAAGDGIL